MVRAVRAPSLPNGFRDVTPLSEIGPRPPVSDLGVEAVVEVTDVREKR